MASWRATRLAITHTIAAGIVMAGMAVCAVLAFVANVVVSAARDSATSPSPVPFLFVAGIMSVVFVLAPITIATEWVARRARLRLWWQIPISIVLLGAFGLGLAALAVSTGAPAAAAPRTAGIATAALVIPLAVYWWALQSAAWLLRAGGLAASRIWPAKFAALGAPDLTIAGRVVEVSARFRIRDRVAFTVGRDPVLVIVGDTVDGTVRDGMQAIATRGATSLTATITSVEIIDPESARMRLLLAPHDHELELWRAVASEGEVLKIA
jgi:hypothetical protein